MRRIETELPGVAILEPRVFGDQRGFFYEAFNQRAFAEVGITATWVQDNHSRSARGVLRGLHYQLGRPQAKLVRVVQGAVYDVAVDIRRGSATFGRWVGATLSADDKRMLYIPEGFAHGFCVLTDTAEFLYKCSDFYAPAEERGIAWNDPDLAIAWPLEGAPLLSAKDASYAPLRAVPPSDLPALAAARV